MILSFESFHNHRVNTVHGTKILISIEFLDVNLMNKADLFSICSRFLQSIFTQTIFFTCISALIFAVKQFKIRFQITEVWMKGLFVRMWLKSKIMLKLNQVRQPNLHQCGWKPFSSWKLNLGKGLSWHTDWCSPIQHPPRWEHRCI